MRNRLTVEAAQSRGAVASFELAGLSGIGGTRHKIAPRAVALISQSFPTDRRRPLYLAFAGRAWLLRRWRAVSQTHGNGLERAWQCTEQHASGASTPALAARDRHRDSRESAPRHKLVGKRDGNRSTTRH